MQDQAPLSEMVLERGSAVALDFLALGIAGLCVLLTVLFVVAVVAGVIAEFRHGRAGLERSP